MIFPFFPFVIHNSGVDLIGVWRGETSLVARGNTIVHPGIRHRLDVRILLTSRWIYEAWVNGSGQSYHSRGRWTTDGRGITLMRLESSSNKKQVKEVSILLLDATRKSASMSLGSFSKVASLDDRGEKSGDLVVRLIVHKR